MQNVNNNSVTNDIYVAHSTDGLNFTYADEPLVASRTGEWDQNNYRSSLLVWEDVRGIQAKLFQSAYLNSTPRVAIVDVSPPYNAASAISVSGSADGVMIYQTDKSLQSETLTYNATTTQLNIDDIGIQDNSGNIAFRATGSGGAEVFNDAATASIRFLPSGT